MPRAARRIPGKRDQRVEHRLHPDAVHPCVRQPRQVAVRERFRLGLQKRIAVDGKVRRTEPRRKPAFPCARRMRRRRRQARHETKERIRAGCQAVGECLADHRADGFGAAPGLLRFRRKAQGFAGGFVAAQFDEQKIVFAQGVGEFLCAPVQQGEQLIIGEQMPVAPDDGDVRPQPLFFGHRRGIGQPHAPPDGANLLRRRADADRHALHRDQFPVQPHERVKPVRKMRKRHRRGCISRREFRSRQ